MVAEGFFRIGYDNIRNISRSVRDYTSEMIEERRPLHIIKNAGVIFLVFPVGTVIAPVYTAYCFVRYSIKKINKIRAKEGELVEKCR